jgi:hypothetical protein
MAGGPFGLRYEELSLVFGWPRACGSNSGRASRMPSTFIPASSPRVSRACMAWISKSAVAGRHPVAYRA